MNYSETMGRGWRITWQNKWLILLALIPALGGMAGLLFSFVTGDFPTDPTTVTPDMLSGLMGRMVLFGCLTFFLVLALGVIGLAARGGMIAGVAGIERGESYGFGRAFRAGWRKVLSLVGMTILLYAVVIIVYLVMLAAIVVPIIMSAAGAAAGQDGGWMEGLGLLGFLAVCCLAVLLIVVTLVISFVYPFAYRGIILRDLGATKAIGHGWRVLRENLGEILLLALPFFVITLVTMGVYLGVYFAVTFPSMMEQMSDALAGATPTAAMGMLNWPFLALYVVYVLIMSVIAAWQSATFTLGYLQWTGKEGLGSEKLPADDMPLNPIV